MGMRITDSRADTPINIRVPAALKKEVDMLADQQGISTAAFVRIALEEKIQREKSEVPNETLEDTIRRVVGEMVAERKNKNGF